MKKFDASLYLAAYPDVSLSGLSPEVHYERYGRLLNRDPAPSLSPDSARTNATLIHSDSSSLYSNGITDQHPAILDSVYENGPIKRNITSSRSDVISVIMPTYNNQGLVKRAINSVLSQNDVAIELIVVDDGSTDHSVSEAKRTTEGHANVSVISLLRNFGCYYARNIGLMNATGAFVAIVDSDDIISPDRFRYQLESIKTQPGKIASLCLQRRWTADFTKPISELKHGENSLLWRREVLDEIGFYDCVRFGGDTEFRLRLQRVYGMDAVARVERELYYLRSRTGSLTTRPESQAYATVGENVRMALSPARQAYSEAFASWQKAKKPQERSGSHELHIAFPQLQRAFSLGCSDQNASPSLGQQRLGCMASFTAREKSLKLVVNNILPQLDRLYVYLNDYKKVPSFLDHEKVVVSLGTETTEGDLRDNGKFFSVSSIKDAYIFTFDDDLNYPSDYVSRMIHKIEVLGRTSVIGVHGVVFPRGDFTQLQQRTVHHFAQAHHGSFVDLLGTGTTAWHSSTLKICLKDFETKGLADVWFARLAALQGVPLFCAARTKNWLTEYGRSEQSLWQEARSQPENYFNVYRKSLAPALANGKIRRGAEYHLSRGFDANTLKSADIVLHEAPGKLPDTAVISSRGFMQPPEYARHPQHDPSDINFHIVINGWNCQEYVDECLRSIVQQTPGSYAYAVTLVDDGSDDGTFEKLATTAILPRARLIRIPENRGPAYARHVAINEITDPDVIVVLVDMDDALESHALKTVAQRYQSDANCLMTIGNWRDQNNKLNPQRFYSDDEIDFQKIRDVELFNATHLRTFKRRLYNQVEETDLWDHEGNWLTTCTDVALMYALMDQCWSNEISFIDEPIYMYRRQHSSGTLARFGKPHKVTRLNWLKSKAPKPKLNRSKPNRQIVARV